MWRQDAANHFVEVAGLVFLQNIEQVLGCTLCATPWEAHALEAIEHGLGGNNAFVICPAFFLSIPAEPEFEPVIGSREAAELVEFAGFGDEEFYPTKEEKGARLGYTLISNHAFVDGNKRIGMYVMLTFLEVNGIHMDCTNEDVAQTGLAVAAGTMDYEALLQWVRDHRL